jgi:hypothetical protein
MHRQQAGNPAMRGSELLQKLASNIDKNASNICNLPTLVGRGEQAAGRSNRR